MTRRATFRTIAGAGAAIIAVTTMGQSVLGQTATGEAVTTANLNLRAGPGTGHSVLRVIPKGSTVTTCNKGQDGVLMVRCDGTTGYDAAENLAPPGAPPSEQPPAGTAKVTTSVNLRSGPSTGHQVLRVVPAGARVATTDSVQNGFRYATHDGLPGWISNQYLIWDLSEAPSGETFTTTTNLRLRAEPNTSSRVLLVMPSGAVVKAMSGKAAGFRQVSCGGTIGWAATDCLTWDCPPSVHGRGPEGVSRAPVYGPVVCRPIALAPPISHIGSGISIVTETISPSPIPRRLRTLALSGRS